MLPGISGAMRICVLSHLYPNPKQPTRGIFIHHHVRGLRRAGIDAAVISGVPWVPAPLSWLKPRWRLLRSIPRSERDRDSTVHYPRFFTLPGARWRAREGISLAKAAAPLLVGSSFNLLHAHTAVPDGHAASRLARMLGIPFLCTIHGYDAIWLRNPGAVRDAILATFRAADRVICITEAVRRRCLLHDPRPEHFVVIHHGVDVPEQPEAPVVELPQGRRAILSVGNLIPQKGFAELLRAFADISTALPDVDLVIVGVGPEHPRLEALAASLGLAERVRFLGWQPYHAVLSLYSQAQVFCLPSQDEGLGVVYLEAMARGVPIIGSEGEGIGDIITHGENGWLIPARNPGAIAAALKRLLTDEDLRSRLGRAGRETAEGLTWDRNAHRHLDLYREVLSA